MLLLKQRRREELTFATAPDTSTCLSVFGGLQTIIQQNKLTTTLQQARVMSS